MIDFGILALFALQSVIVLASLYVLYMLREKIKTLEGILSDAKGLNPVVEGLRRDIHDLAERQTHVDEHPKVLIRRIAEVEGDVGKLDRSLEKLDSKVLSVIGRIGAISRGRKAGRDDEDDDDETVTGRAAKAEGTELRLFPPGPNDGASVIPPGFGKSRRVS